MEVTTSERYASGAPAGDPPAENLYAAFLATVERLGDDPAIVADGEQTSWKELRRRVDAIAGGLSGLGVEKGATVQQLAAGKDPKLTPAQNAVVRAVAADPSIVPKAQGLAGQYKSQLATAAKIDPATQAALAANPSDQQAGIKAVSEISGVSPSDVATIATLNAQHGPALAAARVIDRQTITTLLTDPTNKAALQTGVQEITSKLGISAAQAQARLQDLAKIPIPQLLLLQQSGQKVLNAQAALVALGKVPASDLAFLKKYAALSDPKVQADLKYLQANAPSVVKAAHDSPRQWQHYFWIAVGGEVVFIPLIWLLVGYWRPSRAKQAEAEHEAMVERELAHLRGAAG